MCWCNPAVRTPACGASNCRPPPARAIGLDLGLTVTGFSVLDAAGPALGLLVPPRLVSRGFFAPPAVLKEPQAKADYIADAVFLLVRRYGGRVFIEAPIANVFDAKGRRMTTPQNAQSTGRLFASVETLFRVNRVLYDEIGIGRWRAILVLESRGKEAVVAELKKWLARFGITFPEKVKDDEVESCGIASAGLVAIAHPEVLLPNWKRKRPKKAKRKPAEPAQRGIFDV